MTDLIKVREMLSDLLSCPEAQLMEIITSPEAYDQRGKWLLSKNMSGIHLSLLGEHLGVASYDELVSDFQLVGEPLDEGPWPETFSTKLAAKFREMTNEEITAASEFATTLWKVPEFVQPADRERLEREAPLDLAEYLKNVREFLRNTEQPVFLVNQV